MGRTYQGQDLALGLHIKATKPIDDREVIATAADRLIPDTWLDADGNYYVYPGMETRCADTGQIFVYTGRANNPSDIANQDKWSASGGGSALNMVLMEQDELETLRAADCEEGVLYLGMGEILDSENAFVFGGSFPIQF